MNRSGSIRDYWLTAALLIVSLGVYAYTAVDVIGQARTWVDEVTYITKTWNYVTGQVAPYSSEDPTWYMPLYFYQLGLWQTVTGPGLIESRILSAGVGILSGVLLFDITRRITGNIPAGAVAVTALLTAPAVTFYFFTATPIATVSFLVLLAVWLVVTGLGRPTLLRALALGVVFGLLYFFRQNMLLVIGVVVPLYLLGLRQSRIAHATVLVLGFCCVAVPLLFLFPDRLWSYAIRLPVLTPLLSDLGLFRDPLLQIQANTTGAVGLGLALDKVSWQDITDAFALPFAGLIFASLIVVLLTRKTLRVLLITPLVFFFLAVTHYIGSLDYCQTCILPYTASYAGIGALSAGLAAALIMHLSKKEWLPDTALTLLFTAVVISLNQTASGLATRDEYRFYPSAQLVEPRPIPEREETIQLGDFLRDAIDQDAQVLPIHDLVTVPYALFLAERSFPVQALNLRHSYRQLTPGLTDSERQNLLNVIADQGLWTDEILDAWIETGFDVIVFQTDPRNRDSDLETRIGRSFERTASTGFRGWNVHVYERATDSPAADVSGGVD